MLRKPMLWALVLAAQLTAQVLVSSAGATFPYPVYLRWFDEFHHVRPDAEITYQPVGSGAGIRQLEAGLVDFAASDRPLTDRELSSLDRKMLHIPTVVGAVVPIYNVPGPPRELKFTASSIAGILLGRIRHWNDPELAASNPGIVLPDAPIVPVCRSDVSGTTYVLADFLSKAGNPWPGSADLANFCPGIAARGSAGVAAAVNQTVFSFGYVELAYAVQNRLPYGRVKNRAGNFVKADAASIKAAADSAADSMPDDFRVSIADAPGEHAYPIASYTWLLTPERIPDDSKRAAIIGFLHWILSDGRRTAERLGYAGLPEPVAAKVLAACLRIEP